MEEPIEVYGEQERCFFHRWMKLLGPVRFKEWLRPAFRGSGLFLILLISSIFLPSGSHTQTLSVDLAKMAEMLDTRYYIAEKGETPIRYILLGGLSLY
ncbi:MAG: hypothetical protein KAX38_08930, partial [Candidatus Krumholzibacteria bacterium]|nr:hypothetical protein [Candidatus Krumholzibacteria bacterium]